MNLTNFTPFINTAGFAVLAIAIWYTQFKSEIFNTCPVPDLEQKIFYSQQAYINTPELTPAYVIKISGEIIFSTSFGIQENRNVDIYLMKQFGKTIGFVHDIEPTNKNVNILQDIVWGYLIF